MRFVASTVAYKDIWVSIGYGQKPVSARALQVFASTRAPRISNASEIHPLSAQKKQVMARVYQGAEELSATKFQLPHSLSICEYGSIDLDYKGGTVYFWWIFKS
ncbi:MAG: hypothetical protein GWP10_13615 [Nitrospiraceae bacterium]|nr:hypothetical protein [Nitrospiraceae bacterium]